MLRGRAYEGKMANKSKVFLITGAASGIGAAMAKEAIVRGHHVALADINEDGVRQIAAECGGAAVAYALDIRSEADWTRTLDDIWSRFGRLDVLVNNAAVVHTGYARDVSIVHHEQTLDVNTMGPIIGMLAALPRMKAQGNGHLATVCSMTAFIPFPGLASYAASKHALRAFHHALALEERNSPIRFTIVHPSSTETPMLEKEAADDALALAFAGQSFSADYVAGVVLDAVAKNTVEVFMPKERGAIVRKVGTNPRSLKKMVERNEVIGRERQLERRRLAATKAAE
jgi:NAD(P)-dependent dehydrogenase (short-subunit alcohol dehydrogenase family)